MMAVVVLQRSRGRMRRCCSSSRMNWTARGRYACSVNTTYSNRTFSFLELTGSTHCHVPQPLPFHPDTNMTIANLCFTELNVTFKKIF